MRKALGYQITIDPRVSRAIEADTYTCLHCQRIVERIPFKPPTDEAIGGYCHKCNGPICLNCVGKPCMPVEKFLDLIEKGHHYDELLGRK